jgi:hypothetical protein
MTLSTPKKWKETFLQIYCDLFPLYLTSFLANSTPSAAQITAARSSAKRFEYIFTQLESVNNSHYIDQISYLNETFNQLIMEKSDQNVIDLGKNAFGVLQEFTYDSHRCPDGVKLTPQSVGMPLASYLAELVSLLVLAKEGSPNALDEWDTSFDQIAMWKKNYPHAYELIFADIKKMKKTPTPKQYDDYMNELLRNLKKIETDMGIKPLILAA